ncbi:hypothetical protein R1flu_024302 [Riccia fluitans]|uniref:Uncharacterized protein n=1 Tax=Riccia fluitans TaxID=41844 RepID=A0ABD1XUY0_9MARC
MGRCEMQGWKLLIFAVLSVTLLTGLAQASFDVGSETLVPQRRSLIDGNAETEITRRILAGSGGYYIGYGALTANRVPCPAGSGRSYYTANCQSASGPVRPYQRTCSTASRCARDG